MRLHYFFIFLLLLISASDITAFIDEDVKEYLSDVQNQEYWDGDWSIADEEGTPIKNIKADQF